MQGFSVPSTYNPASGISHHLQFTNPQNEALSFIRNKTNISIEELKSPNLGQPKPERRPPNRRLLARIRSLKHVEHCQSQKLERLRLEKSNAKRNRFPNSVVASFEDQEESIKKKRRVMRVQLENLEKLLEAEQPFWDTSAGTSSFFNTLGTLELMSSSSSEEDEVEMIPQATTPEDITIYETHVDQEDKSTVDLSVMSTGSTACCSSTSSFAIVPQPVEGPISNSPAETAQTPKEDSGKQGSLEISSCLPD